MTDTEYYDLIRPYDDAMKLLLTRLEILNHNIYKGFCWKSWYIRCSTASRASRASKKNWSCKGEEPTLENAKDLLQDIAGIRIVCYFVGDIKNLIDMLKKTVWSDLYPGTWLYHQSQTEWLSKSSYHSRCKCFLSGCQWILSGRDPAPHDFHGFLGCHGTSYFL